MAALAAFAACAPVAVHAEAGYARLQVGGSLSLGDAGGGSSTQDIGTAFGLGSERDSPYLRVVADFGTPELQASGFWLHESGTGVLSDAFGGLPAGTPVASDLELGNAKLAAVLAAPWGPVTFAPGVLFDVFAIDFRASSSPGDREEVDDVVAVPMPFLRVEAPLLAGLQGTVEVGHIDLPEFTGADGRFTDLEARLAWQAGSRVHFLAGYRFLAADAAGESGTDPVAIDLTVRGWFVGGGLRF